MPDISKLPELAQLFGTTIDELLGCKSQVIEAVAADTLEELAACAPIDPKELAQAAPLLTPKQMNEVSESLDFLEIDRALIPNLLPFMSTDGVDTLLRRAVAKDMDISEFLPFASEDAIDRIAREKAEKGEDICCLLPFMYEDTIDEIARRKSAKGESFVTMLPFMDEDTIDDLAIERIRRRERIDELLPFLSSKLLDRLADLAFPDE